MEKSQWLIAAVDCNGGTILGWRGDTISAAMAKQKNKTPSHCQLDESVLGTSMEDVDEGAIRVWEGKIDKEAIDDGELAEAGGIQGEWRDPTSDELLALRVSQQLPDQKRVRLPSVQQLAIVAVDRIGGVVLKHSGDQIDDIICNYANGIVQLEDNMGEGVPIGSPSDEFWDALGMESAVLVWKGRFVMDEDGLPVDIGTWHVPTDEELLSLLPEREI